MPRVRVLEEYCKGCGLCVPVCPRDILSLSKEINVRGVHCVRADASIECTGCCNCAAMCPDAALEVDE